MALNLPRLFFSLRKPILSIFVIAWLGCVAAHALAAPPAPELLLELRRFAEVLDTAREQHVEPVNTRNAIDDAIRGMVSALDADSEYLDAEAYSRLTGARDTAAAGLVLLESNGGIEVRSTIANGPAAQAGIAKGDLVLRVDSIEAYRLGLAGVTQRLQGRPGSTLELTLLKRDSGDIATVRLARARLNEEPVQVRFAAPGIPILRFGPFGNAVVGNTANALEPLFTGAPPTGLILDLRDNSGGLLHSAIGVAAAFLPRDADIVALHGRGSDAQQRYRATPADYLRGSKLDPLNTLPPAVRETPMIIIVNDATASGAEIVAAALQDHGRARLVGTRTLGRSSVQSIVPLSRNRAIKLTTARWSSPKGRTVNGTGLIPDLEVPADSTDRDVQLDAAIRLLTHQ